MTERIIVSGIYRSGTSLTAELVRRWGAYAGREEEILKDQYCYMEYLPLQRFNEELLSNNSRWLPVPVDQLMEKAQKPVFRERAWQILDQMDKEAEEEQAAAWVWKDPLLPLVLPFWAEIWGDVIHVIPVRHPMETILSAARLEGFAPEDVPISAGLAFWQYSMLNLLVSTEASARKFFIAYDQLIQNAQHECTRLCQFLDDQCGVAQDSVDKRISSMVSQVASSQYHHQAPMSLAEVKTSTREQRALYNFLRLKTSYPDESFNQEDFALYPGWREYLQVMDTMLTLSQSQVQGT